MSRNAVCVEHQNVNSVELLHYLKSQKFTRSEPIGFFTLNFVNQMEDKDVELVVHNFRLTIFRQIQVDSI